MSFSEKKSHAPEHITRWDVVFLYWVDKCQKEGGHFSSDLEVPEPNSCELLRNSRVGYQWLCIPLLSPGIYDATGGRFIRPPTPGLCFHKSSMFLYSLSKSSACSVSKLAFVVIAVVHVRSVSITSLSVTRSFFE